MMRFRKCPECGNKTLKIPLISSDFICRECVSVFRISSWFRVVAVALEVFVFLLLLQVCFSLLGGASISLVEFGLLLYILLPLGGAMLVAVVTKYFGALSLKGVKGLRRGNS